MTDLIGIGLELFALPVVFWLGRRRRPAEQDVEPRCTGYIAASRKPDGKFGPYTSQTDCRALRNPTCTDGRCSYHCAALCQCDKPRPAPRSP